jgi:HPt (histidine-containing phosphotransfer) domain-containing protein
MTPRMWARLDPADAADPDPLTASSGKSASDRARTAERAADLAELDGAVRSIGTHARTVNLARAADLQEAVRLVAVGELDDVRRAKAVERAHQLAGSAGTFGFPAASDVAYELEHFLTQAAFDDQQLERARDHITELLAQLRAEPNYD